MYTQLIKIINKEKLTLLFLWIVLTLFNINKAFHIDDTFHLEAAQWIENNPMIPMSGEINWEDDVESLTFSNNPPVYFYFIALIGKLFGYTEISVHLFQSIFVWVAIYFFYKTTKVLGLENNYLPILFLGFCPAFIVNQNIMLDMPLLSIEMVFIYFMLKSSENKETSKYVIASLSIGISLLIKYTLLPLLFVLIFGLWRGKKKRNWLCLFIPIGILSTWSIWNHFEHGSMQIANRKLSNFSLNTILDTFIAFISCLGAISPFAILFYSGLVKSRFFDKCIFALLTCFSLLVIFTYFGIIQEGNTNKLLIGTFLINGTLLLLSTIYNVSKKSYLSNKYSFLILSLLFLSVFILLFAPFIATRHLLLLVPFILLLNWNLVELTSKKIKIMSLISTCILGVSIGISDWEYANFYKKFAQEIKLPKSTKIWSMGHWGWQWYSSNNRMNQYSSRNSQIKDDDIMVYPAGISKQSLSSDCELITLKKVWNSPQISTLISVSNFANMYQSTIKKGAWELSKKPLDTIYICSIKMKNSENTNGYSVFKTYNCASESIDGDHFTQDSSQFFSGMTQTNEISRSGRYCAKLPPSGFLYTIQLDEVREDELIIVSVWFKSDNDSGSLVADTDGPFYKLSKQITETDTKGWKKLLLSVNTENDCVENELTFYVWNISSDTVYYDDFSIWRGRKI